MALHRLRPCTLGHVALGGSAKSSFKGTVGIHQEPTQRHEGVAALWSPALLYELMQYLVYSNLS